MKNYKVQIFGLFAEKVSSLAGNELMARAVEAVTANLVFFIVLVRNTVHKRIIGNSLMKTRVENRNLWNTRHYLFTGLNTVEVCGVVKRSEREAVTDGLLNFGSNENGA